MNVNASEIPLHPDLTMISEEEAEGARTIQVGAGPGSWADGTGSKSLLTLSDERPSNRLATEIDGLGIQDLVVRSAEGSLHLYSRDQADVPAAIKSTLFKSTPDIVVQPFSKRALVEILRFASGRGLPIVVRGAGSSPFGGSMPVKGGMVLDMNGMDGVLAFREEDMTVTVQAGMSWANLDGFLEERGLGLRSCPSSRFSTVGGWVATGGIGVDSLSGGHLSQSVVSLEIVTSEGEVITLAPGDEHFEAIFGSEGRLAVVSAVTLRVKPRVALPSPQLVFFKDLSKALSYATSLSSCIQGPIDVTYCSPAKLKALNRVLGKEHFPESHAVITCFDDLNRPEAAHSISIPQGAQRAHPYLAHLMWNERFFPMKFRKLGPGLMGSEVMAPRSALAGAVDKALGVCAQHGLEPMMEVHFLKGGDGLVLCYYVTDQARTLKYAMDSFRGLLITSAMLDAGALPYSTGAWNFAFSDRGLRKASESLETAKAKLDPKGIMNRGKYPKLDGRFGGVPATLFGPLMLGLGLRLVNALGPVSSRLIGMVSSSSAFDSRQGDELLQMADECAMCGACVGVCPAYLATRDERVTGRGKLLTARLLAEGSPVTQEHARRSFLCMRCKACEQVCQSKLHLIPAYEELERRLERLHGKDEAEISKFIEQIEKSPVYEALVDRGLVLGAPSRGSEGGS